MIELSKKDIEFLLRLLNTELRDYQIYYIKKHAVDNWLEDVFTDEDLYREILPLMNIINKLEGVDERVTPSMAIESMKKVNCYINSDSETPVTVVKEWMKDKHENVGMDFFTFKKLYECAKNCTVEEFIMSPWDDWMNGVDSKKVESILRNVHKMANGSVSDICEVSGKSMKSLSDDMSVPYATVQRWKSSGIPERDKMMIAFAVLSNM